MVRKIIFILLAVVSNGVIADIYQHTDSAGHVSYSSTPEPDSKKVVINPPEGCEVVIGIPPSGWVESSASNGGSLKTYVNSVTIHKAGDKVKMWSMYDYWKVHVNDGRCVMSVKSQVEYDCKEGQVRTISFVSYSKNMGDGDVVYNQSSPTEWEPFVPDTVGESMWKFACEKR